MEVINRALYLRAQTYANQWNNELGKQRHSGCVWWMWWNIGMAICHKSAINSPETIAWFSHITYQSYQLTCVAGWEQCLHGLLSSFSVFWVNIIKVFLLVIYIDFLQQWKCKFYSDNIPILKIDMFLVCTKLYSYVKKK